MPRILLAFATLLLALPARAATTVERDIEFFEQHVRPLLAKHCFECHGSKKAFSELRLDSRTRTLQGGENGPAIVPGKPEESLLVEAIRRESFEMPPDEALADEQIEILIQWIRRGAVWPEEVNQGELDRQRSIDQHWAFQAIADPPVPEVKQADWPKNAIDHFILARLEAASLSPSLQADRGTLLRRMAWDLTGLPATAEQRDVFLSADEKPSIAALADEMLDSPHLTMENAGADTGST